MSDTKPRLGFIGREPGRRRIELHDLVRRHSPPMNAAANVEYEED